ncbi:MAG: segregation and condensation protein A, partial [Myxococcales bacterium]
GHTPLPPHLAFRVALPNFEGPLDLLMHLIREHKIDIFDIPIALITEKYLETLEVMKQLDLDVAGEFIMMAASLAHIKSRMLLPRQEVSGPEETQEEQGDPREELVRRLLNYQKYRAAAEELGRMDVLDRDVFTRKVSAEPVPLGDNEVGFAEVSVFKLIEALDRALKAAKKEIPHQVFVDRLSIGDAISKLIDRLKSEPKLSFFELLAGQGERHRIVVTFLALLEMCKLRLIRIYQETEHEDIIVSARNTDALASPAEVTDDYK